MGHRQQVNERVGCPPTGSQTSNRPTHALVTDVNREKLFWKANEVIEKEEDENEGVQDSPLAAAIRAWSCSASVGGCGQGPVPMATSGPPVALWGEKKKTRGEKKCK